MKWHAMLTTLTLALIAAVSGLAWWGYWSWQEVSVTVRAGAHSGTHCLENRNYPIPVIIQNKSWHTVERVQFRISIKEKGETPELTSGTPREADQIFEPGDMASACWQIPPRIGQQSEEHRLEFAEAIARDPSSYVISAERLSVTFK
ncbi:hypothetical protein [Roseobacter sp. A03A-229]